VVDDDPQVVDLVCQLLEDEACEIRSAADGQEALEAISQQPPDIILLDLLMPRLDGFDVIEQLRQSPQHCDIPIVILTAKTLNTDELAQLQESASKVMQKQGLERETLLQELRNALQAYHQRSELKG
jgi:CheY-like chemotaxis protein